MKRSVLLLLCGLAIAPLIAGQADLAIVEKVAGAVGFYTAQGQRVAGVKVGTHPHEIVASPDHRYLYVSNNGILWMQYAGEGGNTISVIDAKEHKKVADIDLGNYRRPHGMDLDPKTGRLLVTIENPDGLLLIDTRTRKVLRKYDVKGEDPHMVLFGPSGEYAFVSNTATNAIAAIHLESGEVKLIPADGRPQGGVFSHDGKRLYITSEEGNAITIIDVGKQERVGKLSVATSPARIALTPDGKTLVYNCHNCIAFANVATGKQEKVIDLTGRPLSMTLSPDGKLAYLGIQDQDKVVVVSVPERKIVREFQTPEKAGPDPVMPLSAGL